MKKRAVIIRAVCYILMLAAVLAWPIKEIIQIDFQKAPPQKFLLPIQSKGENNLRDYFGLKSGFLKGEKDDTEKREKIFFISFWCIPPAWYTIEIPTGKP